MDRIKLNPRLVVIVGFSIALVIVLFFATGGSLPGAGNPTPTSAPQAEPTTAVAAAISGEVTSHVTRMSGHTWRFVYVVRNIGSVPIAGLQLNGPAANLFHIANPPGWTYYGSGTCSHSAPGVLIYWSTGATAKTMIAPHKSARFSFDANTAGPTTELYSLSFGSAHPLFGHLQAPAASRLPAPQTCRGGR